MTTLTALTAQLAASVPAKAGVPTTAQYEQAIKDAAADLGRRCPRRLVGVLSVVPGTATYALPAGFRKMIRLDRLTGGTVRRDASGMLVPFSMSFTEDTVIDNGQITFFPTPQYTLDRQFIYMAGFPYDGGSDAFLGLPDDYEGALMLKAQAVLLRQMGNGSAGGFAYQIGDVRVDKKDAGSSYSTQAATAEDAYLAAVAAINGKVGVRGDYRPEEYL